MMPGTCPRPAYSTASRAGRPVMTARVPARSPRRRSTAVAPGSARAAAGSGTIGASVPSKSSPIRAAPGSATSASSPARPAAVRGTGSGDRRRADGPRSGWFCESGTGLVWPRIRAGGAHPATAGSLPAEPGDQGRVELSRLRPVDDLIQQLVVPGGRHGEGLEDLPLLGAGKPPPAALEGEDALVRLGERRHLAPLYRPESGPS